jgi:hypothetical protein
MFVDAFIIYHFAESMGLLQNGQGLQLITFFVRLITCLGPLLPVSNFGCHMLC